MFCPKCGNEVLNGDLFCRNCGAKLEQPESTQAMQAAPQPDVEQAFHEPVNEMAGKANTTAVESAGSVPLRKESYNYEDLPTTKPEGIHSIYVIDFFIRMTESANIPLFIYLIINVIIIGLFATAFFALPIGWGIAVGFLLYLASVSIALSPVGEWLLRRQTGCVKIEEKEVIDRLEPLFREVYYKAKKENPMISSDVRLFINDDECPNAFATGRKTVCVTRGLLSMTDEQIKATLGHEFGHLSHKDTDRILVVSVGNTVITGVLVLFQIGLIISDIFMQIVAAIQGDEEGFFMSIMSTISKVIGLFIIKGFMKVWSALGVALCMKTSRGNEYLADQFSFELGFGEGLCSMLASLGGGARPVGLFANLASSHPASEDRIARLQEMIRTQRIEG